MQTHLGELQQAVCRKAQQALGAVLASGIHELW
jgi:hypothetical protein